MRIVVGVGANLGDRFATIGRAVERLASLPFVRTHRVSTWFETAPVGGPPQPPFINGAVLLEIDDAMTPSAVVRELLSIERALGRTRGDERNEPRVMDLDLLWTDGPPSRDPDAVVPHPRLHERPFALAPLVDLLPDARDAAGHRYADHLARLDRGGIRQLDPRDPKIDGA
jgi:2-amino-4-hydroxy-6-hydroxymethyldihydropteridine diphosphokinase